MQKLILLVKKACYTARRNYEKCVGFVSNVDLILQMKALERITVMKQRKTKKQDFHLKDDTDSIKVSVWGENTQQCKGLLVGDIVKVTNVKTNYFRGVTSVNSTPFTRIHKVAAKNLYLYLLTISC